MHSAVQTVADSSKYITRNGPNPTDKQTDRQTSIIFFPFQSNK